MGVSMTLNVGDSLPGVGELTEDFMVIELKGGKKAIVTSNGETKEGTWEKGEEKGTIVVTIEEQSITFVKDGKTLSFTMEGAGQVVLSK
jgi:Zn/Cd-binding protein ZinT